jgi:FdhD protein
MSRDRIAVEEPLEIRLNGKSVAVVMRSPGNDEELACGFLFTEGLLKGKADLESIGRRRQRGKTDHGNVIEAVSRDSSALAKRGWQRNFVSASSCGLCGKLTIESVRLQAPPVHGDDLKVAGDLLYGLTEKMRALQAGFDETGGIHAAGLFDASGDLLLLREDIGRHNAVDKVVGKALLDDRLPLSSRILLVSGRASFEIVQKALMARIPFVAAVSAASSLAIELAETSRMALVGFLRGSSMNVYCGAERIA